VLAWCRQPMGYVHGHAACRDGACAMLGLNQAECCDGETSADCPAPTAAVAASEPSALGAAVTSGVE